SDGRVRLFGDAGGHPRRGEGGARRQGHDHAPARPFSHERKSRPVPLLYRARIGGDRRERINPMKIVKVETLHCDAGWRVNSFLKVSTDEGLVGWSEFMEGYGAQGLGTIIERLGARLVGQDPRPVERHTAYLYAATRQAAGGLNAQAIAAIENALV